MAVREILLLGNPKLYEISAPVLKEELEGLKSVIEDLHDTMLDFKHKYGAGRAIAAPQIGVMKRLIYMYIQHPTVFINPVMDQESEDMMTVWDDCMSFPELLVKVKRYRSFRLTYRDQQWREQTATMEDDLSELLQHEYDHLDGVLAVSKAVDAKSFALRNQRKFLCSV
ncbi:MAG: peptide deformylase [SAR324 cluster bacterium]|nr:peptide deformylase [SAR324 cluster bacterium]